MKTKNDEKHALNATTANPKRALRTMQQTITTIKCIERNIENKNKNNAATTPTNRNQKRRRSRKREKSTKNDNRKQKLHRKKCEIGCWLPNQIDRWLASCWRADERVAWAEKAADEAGRINSRIRAGSGQRYVYATRSAQQSGYKSQHTHTHTH